MLDELIAQIRAAPDDDAPRLVLADKLAEQGDPWGELIALSCRLAAQPDDALRAHVQTLRHARWPLPRCAAGFERGFFTQVWADDAAVAGARGLAFALLRVLRVRNVTDAGLAALADSELPGVAGTVRLERADQARRLTPARLVDALAGARCHTLVLRDLALAPGTFGAIVANRELAVRELEISERGQPVLGGALALVSWPQLEALRLHGRLGREHLFTFLAVDAIRGLAELDLSYNPVDNYVVGAIAETPWRRIETLRLRATDIGNYGVAALAASPALRGLKRLAFGAPFHGAEPYRDLPQLAALRELVELDLSSQRLDENELVALAGLSLPELARLDLSYCHIDDARARILATSLRLPAALALDLRGNPITDAAAELRARFASVML